MDERVKFVARRLAGEPMADLCREFGISRKTGYKIFRSLSGMRHSRAQRPQPTSLSLCQSTALSGGELHSKREA